MTILKDQRTRKRFDQDWVENILDDLIEKEFTGKFEINFFHGGVTNCNRFESMKPPEQF